MPPGEGRRFYLKGVVKRNMGIRVNKLIGYGILDLATKLGHTPSDPRWDYEKYHTEWRQGRQEVDLREFMEWLKKPENVCKIGELAHYEGWGFGRMRANHPGEDIEMFLLTEAIKDRLKNPRHRSWSAPYDAVIWQSEYGDPKVVLFQCPEHPDWFRHDDIIDYYEEKGEGRATLLNNTGIWPYDGFIKRARPPTPEIAAKLSEATRLLQALAPPAFHEMDGAEITGLDGGRFNQLVGRWDPGLEPLIKDPDLLKHFLTDWRPRVPLGILACMVFLDCFPDYESPDSMLNSLRPMIYVYWG